MGKPPPLGPPPLGRGDSGVGWAVGGPTSVAEAAQRDRWAVGDLAINVGKARPEPDVHGRQVRPLLPGVYRQTGGKRPARRIGDVHTPGAYRRRSALPGFSAFSRA